MAEVQYLEGVIAPLLAHREEMSIERRVDELGVLLTVSLSKEDMGRIIGKNGETARAIRKLVRQFGLQNQSRISLKINEPE